MGLGRLNKSEILKIYWSIEGIVQVLLLVTNLQLQTYGTFSIF